MTTAPSSPARRGRIRRRAIAVLAVCATLATAVVPAAVASQPAGSGHLPTAPRGVRIPALAFDDHSVSLVWNAPDDRADVAGYHVYENDAYIGTAGQDSVSAAQPFIDAFYADPADGGQTRTLPHAYTVEGLNPSTRYRFTVRAVDAAGHESADSAVVVQTTTASPRVFDVRDYGAVGDGTTLDTKAIQAAIDAATPGSEVLLADGVYKSGALWLKSDLTFDVATGATLLGSENAADYPFGFQLYEYSTDPRYHSLLNAQTWDYGSLHDIRITGGGTIDGNGWVQQGLDAQGFPISAPSSSATVSTNGILAKSEVAAATAIGDAGAYSTRSNLITLRGVHNAYIGGINAIDPAFHTIASLHSSNVTLANDRLTTYNINNGDGIDFAHGSGLTIFGTVFDTGDDAVNFAAGLGAQAPPDGPTGGAWIFDDYFRNAHGAVAFGSHTGAWIQNVLAEDDVIDGSQYGLRMKTVPQNGGGVREVTFRDNALRNITVQAFSFTANYNDPNAFITVEPASDPAYFTEVDVDHVTVDGAGTQSIEVLGLPGDQDTRLHFSDVTFLNATPASLSYLKDSSFQNVVYRNTLDPWQITNSSGLAFTGTTTATTTTQDAGGVPVWPRGASLTAAASATSVDLAWPAASDNVGISNYGAYVDGALAATYPGTATSGEVTGLAPDRVHSIRITALDATGNAVGGPATTVRTTGAPDTTAPTAPAGTTAFAAVSGDTGATWAEVAWTAATDDYGIGRYELYQDGRLIARLARATSQYTPTGLSPGTAYTFRLKAVDTSGNAAWYPVTVTLTTAPAVTINPIPTACCVT
ncbi:fibronectin type III domain-containing protein [Actinospica robiniae]|uniref:fibronectin type III domain-containing protein n=1 Tax=Actinospica robiniae TaxID=304901 RepID=UPI00146FC19F|nr:glycosyl hydrolase family 28 protein [Actinospica robiniae]